VAKPIYFASDFHLGLGSRDESLIRERRIIQWLDSVKDNAESIYLLGDIFDHWFEYKQVVPKGYFRLLAKLADIVDSGVEIYVFTGNHDMWLFDYLEKEIGVVIHRQPIRRTLQGKHILMGHGDGLGPGDYSYKFIKKVFSSKINQWLFARLHPNLGIALMQYLSRSSRESQEEEKFLGPDKEWLILFCESVLEKEEIDYFIFGHRHLAIDYTLRNGRSRYINCGDWITLNTYAMLENGVLSLKEYQW